MIPTLGDTSLDLGLFRVVRPYHTKFLCYDLSQALGLSTRSKRVTLTTHVGALYINYNPLEFGHTAHVQRRKYEPLRFKLKAEVVCRRKCSRNFPYPLSPYPHINMSNTWRYVSTFCHQERIPETNL